MERYRIEVGHRHGVKPGNIVGAIANEAGLDGEHIGHIQIESDHSLVDLPVGMPKDIYMDLKKVRICGEAIRITRLDEAPRPSGSKRKPPRGPDKRKAGSTAGPTTPKKNRATGRKKRQRRER